MRRTSVTCVLLIVAMQVASVTCFLVLPTHTKEDAYQHMAIRVSSADGKDIHARKHKKQQMPSRLNPHRPHLEVYLPKAHTTPQPPKKTLASSSTNFADVIQARYYPSISHEDCYRIMDVHNVHRYKQPLIPGYMSHLKGTKPMSHTSLKPWVYHLQHPVRNANLDLHDTAPQVAVPMVNTIEPPLLRPGSKKGSHLEADSMFIPPNSNKEPHPIWDPKACYHSCPKLHPKVFYGTNTNREPHAMLDSTVFYQMTEMPKQYHQEQKQYVGKLLHSQKKTTNLDALSHSHAYHTDIFPMSEMHYKKPKQNQHNLRPTANLYTPLSHANLKGHFSNLEMPSTVYRRHHMSSNNMFRESHHQLTPITFYPKLEMHSEFHRHHHKKHKQNQQSQILSNNLFRELNPQLDSNVPYSRVQMPFELHRQYHPQHTARLRHNQRSHPHTDLVGPPELQITVHNKLKQLPHPISRFPHSHHLHPHHLQSFIRSNHLLQPYHPVLNKTKLQLKENFEIPSKFKFPMDQISEDKDSDKQDSNSTMDNHYDDYSLFVNPKEFFELIQDLIDYGKNLSQNSSMMSQEEHPTQEPRLPPQDSHDSKNKEQTKTSTDPEMNADAKDDNGNQSKVVSEPKNNNSQELEYFDNKNASNSEVVIQTPLEIVKNLNEGLENMLNSMQISRAEPNKDAHVTNDSQVRDKKLQTQIDRKLQIPTESALHEKSTDVINELQTSSEKSQIISDSNRKSTTTEPKEHPTKPKAAVHQNSTNVANTTQQGYEKSQPKSNGSLETSTATTREKYKDVTDEFQSKSEISQAKSNNKMESSTSNSEEELTLLEEDTDITNKLQRRMHSNLKSPTDPEENQAKPQAIEMYANLPDGTKVTNKTQQRSEKTRMKKTEN